MVMQLCDASMTTATPLAPRCSIESRRLPRSAAPGVGGAWRGRRSPGGSSTADDLAVGDIGDVGLADERQEVVLAGALERGCP